VASGVKCRKLKALGPENAWPIATVYQDEPRCCAVHTLCLTSRNWLLSSSSADSAAVGRKWRLVVVEKDLHTDKGNSKID
jgi:hypothetical protein